MSFRLSLVLWVSMLPGVSACGSSDLQTPEAYTEALLAVLASDDATGMNRLLPSLDDLEMMAEVFEKARRSRSDEDEDVEDTTTPEPTKAQRRAYSEHVWEGVRDQAEASGFQLASSVVDTLESKERTRFGRVAYRVVAKLKSGEARATLKFTVFAGSDGLVLQQPPQFVAGSGPCENARAHMVDLLEASDDSAIKGLISSFTGSNGELIVSGCTDGLGKHPELPNCILKATEPSTAMACYEAIGGASELAE